MTFHGRFCAKTYINTAFLNIVRFRYAHPAPESEHTGKECCTWINSDSSGKMLLVDLLFVVIISQAHSLQGHGLTYRRKRGREAVPRR